MFYNYHGIQSLVGKTVRCAFADSYTATLQELITANPRNIIFTLVGFDNFGVNLLVGDQTKTQLTDDAPVIYVPLAALGAIVPATWNQASLKRASA